MKYKRLLFEQFRRGGIPRRCVEVEIRNVTPRGEARPVFVGMVRLVEWDPIGITRLLIGLPLLEKNLKRSVKDSWVLEVSDWHGLWIHASTALQTNAHAQEVRQLVVSLESTLQGSSAEVWSVRPPCDTDFGALSRVVSKSD